MKSGDEDRFERKERSGRRLETGGLGRTRGCWGGGGGAIQFAVAESGYVRLVQRLVPVTVNRGWPATQTHRVLLSLFPPTFHKSTCATSRLAPSGLANRFSLSLCFSPCLSLSRSLCIVRSSGSQSDKYSRPPLSHPYISLSVPVWPLNNSRCTGVNPFSRFIVPTNDFGAGHRRVGVLIYFDFRRCTFQVSSPSIVITRATIARHIGLHTRDIWNLFENKAAQSGVKANWEIS